MQSFKLLSILALICVLVAGGKFANAAAFTFGSPVAVDDSRPASEPGVAVDPQGRIFINAPSGIVIGVPLKAGPSFVWRSTNGGANFQFAGPGTVGAAPNGVGVIIGGGDSNLAIDAASNLYFIDLWLGNSSTAASHNSGKSWEGQPFGNVPIQDRPWVSADPAPKRTKAVFSVTEELGTGIFISESLSPIAGEAYPISMLEVSDEQRGLIGAAPAGNLVTNVNGDTYNVYSIFTGKNGAGIGLSKLPRGSLRTVNSSVTPAADAHDQTQCFPVVAADSALDGNLYLTWCDPVSTSQWNIRFASFNGRSWSNAVTLGHGVYPWVTAQAPGKVDVAWYSAAASGWIGDPNQAPNNAVWSVDFAQSINALSATPVFTAPVAAAADVKTGIVCTQGTGCSADREFGDFLSISHDGAGRALIAYVVVPKPGQGLVRLVRQAGGTTIN